MHVVLKEHVIKCAEFLEISSTGKCLMNTCPGRCIRISSLEGLKVLLEDRNLFHGPKTLTPKHLVKEIITIIDARIQFQR